MSAAGAAPADSEIADWPDLVVVSDLHIGRGFNPHTRRFHALETFFFDEDFQSFARWLCRRADERGRGLRLVLNGDVFDFLRINRLPDIDHKPSAREARFGPELTPDNCARIAEDILSGHPLFAAALGHILAAGHEVIFLPGNHDLEVHWAPVQAVIREAILASLDDDTDREAASARLVFKPWFHHEPGRIWIEHGCQYDPENAFRFPLRGRLAEDAGFSPEGEADMPLGNFFQRYLYNAFGSITFIVPTSRANGRYLKWLLFNEPRLLLRVARSHVPFAVQVLRRLASGQRALRRQYKEAHTRELEALAERSGLGDTLREIDKMKHDGADAVRAVQVMAREGGQLAIVGGLSVFIVVVLWVTAGHAINALEVGFGWKALLSLLLNLLLVVGAGGFLLQRSLRLPASTPRPLKRAAQKLSTMLDVPLVCFGHTHEEGVFPLEKTTKGREAWYLNTGTWIAVFTHDVLLPRERVQFTFLDIEGKDAQLRHWSPGRDGALPVILLDE